MSDATLSAVLDDVDGHLTESLDRLFELLRIPSISTDPEYAGDCKRAAEWLASELADIGFRADTRPTAGHPVVVAHDRTTEGAHVLFYGHYDVQPVDPISLWDTPPFEPIIVTAEDGTRHIVGRGASDDKGQLMTFVEACRAWRRVAGQLPLSVTMLLEGEEESGSANLPTFLDAAASELTADVALVCDTDMWDRHTPAVISMLRGLVAEEIEITAADKDLHSGMYGAAARNPNQVLADIVASLRDADGAVAIEGFYDDVRPLAPDVLEFWRNLGFDEAAFLADVGLSNPAGEKDRSVLEQIWSRPTCEINGMWGGYTGEGVKTVIPSRARAKITFRLVADQDPMRIRQAFRDHIRARLPADCSVKFFDHSAAPAVAVPSDGAHVRAALAALEDEWQHPAVIIGSGGSIPVVSELKQRLGIDTLLIGFAQRDDRIHSPNEKYDLESFQHGIRSWVRILHALAAGRPRP